MSEGFPCVRCGNVIGNAYHDCEGKSDWARYSRGEPLPRSARKRIRKRIEMAIEKEFNDEV